jgi:hypothetical protein
MAASSPINSGDRQVSEGDPTDHVLAAIASILDKSEASDRQEAVHESYEPEAARDEPAVSDQPEPSAEETPVEPPAAAAPSVAPSDIDADSYTRYGPGPLAAIRFKWTTRRDDNGDYFVHETIGENSHPLVSGPMTREAAIKFVDDHEHQARQRFEALRSEMAGGEIGRSRDEHS